MVSISAVSGGATHNSSRSSIEVAIFDDGDVSPPGDPFKPILVGATGGTLLISLDLSDPVNTGGALETIQTRSLYRFINGVAVASPLHVNNLKALTTYVFSCDVTNSEYRSAQSFPLVVSTTRPTVPSAPLQLELQRVTGGMLIFSWLPPFDTGGVELVGYNVRISDGTISATASVGLDNTLQLSSLGEQRLRANRTYGVMLAARNLAGTGMLSEETLFHTLPAVTQPSAPNPSVASVDSSSITMNIEPPHDAGGVPLLNLTYSVFIRRTSSSRAFLAATAAAMAVRVTNLLAATQYLVSVLANVPGSPRCLADVTASAQQGSDSLLLQLGGQLTTSEASLADILFEAGPMVGMRLGDENSSPIVQVSVRAMSRAEVLQAVLARSIPLHQPFDQPTITDVPVCLCGLLSEEIVVWTPEATAPGKGLPPRVLNASGGQLEMQLTSPADTGGVAVVSFIVLMTPRSPSAVRNHLAVDTELESVMGPDDVLEFRVPAMRDASTELQASLFAGRYEAMLFCVDSSFPHVVFCSVWSVSTVDSRAVFRSQVFPTCRVLTPAPRLQQLCCSA